MREIRPVRFDYVVCYDVSTVLIDGEARLRKIAKVCEGFGTRVQDSVFECRLTAARLERLKEKMRATLDLRVDSFRIYRLTGPRDEVVEAYGVDRSQLDKPLVF
uniref:CRISPR-associated endoribonuclease Cas2 n=1 Tax=Anaerolinea thermolimosa TaxID=229919 RepID=A0A7C4KJC2_9CHLR